ncbi:MAG: S24 family peptidase [Deltaproteobacteria bacterium]|nr:S24 family peptidase [Deltaproteobacteria bacterium]
MHPILRDGAIVCIDTKARPEEKKVPKGSIWAVRKDEGAVVKFIQVGEDMIALLSANPNYPPEAVTDPEAIIGRVVWMWQGV